MQGSNGKKHIQLDDIASALRLSPSTVSRAISGRGRVSARTRGRVLEYIEQHEYQPNGIARSLAKSLSYNIGVALPSETLSSEIPFFQTAMMGAVQSALGHDYDVIVFSASDSDVSSLRRLISNRKVDGVVLTRSVLNDPNVKYLQEQGVPFVLIGTSEDVSVAQVDTDNAAACRELTAALLASGLHRPGFIYGNGDYMVNRARLDGFYRGALDAGISIGECFVAADVTDSAAVSAAADRLTAGGADCIFCGDDFICRLVLAHMAETAAAGARPRIASFFNSALLENSVPAVPAVDIDARALGSAAAEELFELLGGRLRSGGPLRLCGAYSIKGASI